MPKTAAVTAVTTKTRKKKKNGQSELGAVMSRLKKNKTAMFGLYLFLLLVVLAIIAPYITPYGYAKMTPAQKFKTPSWEHLFGTDEYGRDVFSRIMYGGRYSLSIGLLATAFSMAIGIVVGAAAGYYGGKVDNIIMRILDIFQAIPMILLTIVISAALGSGFDKTIFALALSHVPEFARTLRASILGIRDMEYIEAADAIGCSTLRQITKYVLPNAFAPLLVTSTMNVANTILLTASLSYIGLGIQPPTPEWGAMLSAAKGFIRNYPYLLIFPGLFIAITVLSLNMFGDGLRDALDPKLKD
jgi:peptide/nickel transport system permease protein